VLPPRIVSRAARAPRPVRPGGSLLALRPAFRALATSAGTPRGLRRGLELLLSWDSPTSRPSADRPSARPLPEAEASFGGTVPPVSRVSPSWFLTTSAACSARGLRVCCTPLPALGFGAFPASASRTPEGARQVHRVPRVAVHTLRRVPLVSSRTASLRPLPSCRCRVPAVAGEPACCPGDAPIRRGGPPRHQPGGATGEPASLPRSAERSASRPCSADESVVTHRRCQQRVARVSHGLGSPSRSSMHPRSPGVRLERVQRRLGETRQAGEPPSASPARPPQRVAMARSAVSLLGFPAASRPPAEAVTAGVA
jgi:hypothetical protein